MAVQFNRGVVPVGQHYVTAALGASALTNLVAPAANAHGLIIRTLTLNAGDAAMNIFANAAAPSSASDVGTRIIFEFSSASAGDSDTLPYEVYVYPGQGLWASNSITNGSGQVFMTYDLIVPDQAS